MILMFAGDVMTFASFTVTPWHTSKLEEFYEAQHEEQEYCFIFFVPALGK